MGECKALEPTEYASSLHLLINPKILNYGRENCVVTFKQHLFFASND